MSGDRVMPEHPVLPERSPVPAVLISDLHKSFGHVRAVDGVDLVIDQGEFFTMLGPSGSGKTTLLRIIGGFESVDSGTVEIFGVDMTRTPPYDRDVNTVFQNYALFPHMSVRQNVEYGLRVKRVPKTERAQKAEAALTMVGLSAMGGRKPDQLSGGQRQRVVIAGALALEPKLLVADEPVASLDASVRGEILALLLRLRARLGLAALVITHDLGLAWNIADRVAVMYRGELVEVGPVDEVLRDPKHDYTRSLLAALPTTRPKETDLATG